MGEYGFVYYHCRIGFFFDLWFGAVVDWVPFSGEFGDNPN